MNQDRPRNIQSRNIALANYKIIKVLGKGSFGKVFLVAHKQTKLFYAMKQISKSSVNKGDFSRIRREIEILAKTSHPNVVKLIEAFETPTNFLLIMEYCSGGELFDYIVKRKRLSEEEASVFFYQIISAVNYLHSSNIIHRDIKPENILLTRNNVVKIIDFGLSNFTQKNQLLSTPCGSPCYAPPEMLMGKSYEGPPVDIWSVGVVLFAMVSGYLPFQEKTNKELVRRIIECEYGVPIWVSPSVKNLLNKILKKNPNDRIKINDIKQESFYIKGRYHFYKRVEKIIGYQINEKTQNDQDLTKERIRVDLKLEELTNQKITSEATEKEETKVEKIFKTSLNTPLISKNRIIPTIHNSEKTAHTILVKRKPSSSKTKRLILNKSIIGNINYNSVNTSINTKHSTNTNDSNTQGKNVSLTSNVNRIINSHPTGNHMVTSSCEEKKANKKQSHYTIRTKYFEVKDPWIGLNIIKSRLATRRNNNNISTKTSRTANTTQIKKSILDSLEINKTSRTPYIGKIVNMVSPEIYKPKQNPHLMKCFEYNERGKNRIVSDFSNKPTVGCLNKLNQCKINYNWLKW